MFEFKMPKLGADMDEGILLEWKISPGDVVHKGDVVAVVETSKGAIDIEAFVDGQVESLIIKPDSTVPVGAVMAHFRLSDEPTTNDSAHTADATVVSAKTKETQMATPVVAGRSTRSTPERLMPKAAATPVSPRARRLASQLNVDLATLTGTGPAGSIVAEDVQAATDANGAPTLAAGKSVEQTDAVKGAEAMTSTMRSTIAAAMSRSKREIPHYYLAHDIDVSALLSLVENWNEGHSVAERILPAVLYYKAIGTAAAEFESMNGFYSNDAWQPAKTVNLGVAISIRGGGLIAPCLMDVANKPAVDLMRELKDLVARSRKGGLRGSEMSEGTLTVSNLGDRGVDSLYGVIYPPQVALVGIGTMRKRVWVVDGEPGVRPIVSFSLSADHRVSNGHTGALFLRRIEELIGSPKGLM